MKRTAIVACLMVGVSLGANPSTDELRMRRTPVVEAYERARDSIVNISTSQKIRVSRPGLDIFGFPDVFSVPAERSSIGSGFVIHEDGYIATNAHVVSAADRLQVTFADGATQDAEVIGRDNLRDLAVIKIEPEKPVKPIRMGRSDDLIIGEPVLAIGNPVGLQNTLTTGVVSALHRELNVNGQVMYRDVIQTDASINPGNSGGPLLNILGELIGINTAIRADAQNIGFAIPVAQLRDFLPEILDPEKLNHVQLGMRVGDGHPARVTFVREDSPAERAGIKLGDIVSAVDGRALKGDIDFYVSMLGRKEGEAVSLALERSGKPVTAKVTLTPIPKPDGKQLAMQRLGLNIVDVKESAAKRFRWTRNGVLVVAVEPKSPADRADLRPGDLIVSMGPYWIAGVDQVGALLSGVRPGDRVDVGVRRQVQGMLVDDEARLFAR